ncbi:SDR family oxidoreductase [Rhodococcus aerolatus]
MRPTALVTGATRGLGLAVAQALAPTHDVLVGGRDADAVDAVCAGLPGARAFVAPLTDDAALAQACAGIGSLDVLVHSAGVGDLGTVEESGADLWRRTLEVNVVAVAELTRLLLPALRAARGHVVAINSGAGLSAKPGWGAYAASKFALRALTDALREEEVGHGVRVTSVHPGRIDTDMQRAVVEHEGGTYRAEDFLTPQTVAAAVLAAVQTPRDAQPTEVVLRPLAR